LLELRDRDADGGELPEAVLEGCFEEGGIGGG